MSRNLGTHSEQSQYTTPGVAERPEGKLWVLRHAGIVYGAAGRALELALVIAAFALTRFLCIHQWHLPVGDVGLYYRYALLFWTQAPRLHALPLEYPPLAIVPFSLTLVPRVTDYYALFAGWMGVLAVLGYLGFVRYSTRHRALVYTLYLAVGATGTLLARFDLVPALLTLAALWAAQRRHFSGAYLLLAAGTLTKLYPVVLLPVVLIADARAAPEEAQPPPPDGQIHKRRARPMWLTWGAGSPWLDLLPRWRWPAVARAARGAALCLGVVAAGFGCAAALNRGSAFSSFAYLGARPVQVESIPASVLWLGTLLGIPAGPNFSFSSLNYIGPLDIVVKPLAALSLLALCCLVYARQARGRLSVEQAFLAVLCIVIVTNKVLSPQYLIWVLPVVAAVEGFDAIWLAVCVLTTVIYPILYLTQPTFATVTETRAFLPIVAARNLLLIAITIRAVWRPAPSRDSAHTSHAGRAVPDGVPRNPIVSTAFGAC
jgi:hypothetical protein